jgi:lipopolysaccharide/colanic/teichoic acid biosynthesis glycosyltransferase
MSKRLLDIVISTLLLIALSPLCIFAGFIIFLKLGSPVLFRQIRPGLNGEPFEMIKFRSMTDKVGSNGELLTDEQRLTSFGLFLRSTSFDELPELWNVLKGDMSLVGPRPLLLEYLPLYSLEQIRRHDVRPGITGWAQVNGRNAISWDDKFALDIWYVDNQSFFLDIKILCLTMLKVLGREDISAPGDVTMPIFEGKINEDELR